MSQTVHILKKDARYLRNEIGLLVVLSILYAWLASHAASAGLGSDNAFAEVFGAIAAFVFYFIAVVVTILIGLVVQAEALPGDKQFWITRPYRWLDLLTAKLLFILLFVNLPIFAARLLIVVMDGIPLTSALPALVSSQVWLFCTVGLSTAAVAALTPGLVPFIFSMAGLWFVGAAGINLFRELENWPPSMNWIRDSAGALALVAFCSSILYLEYKSRRTLLVRILALGAIVVVLMTYRYVPLTFALNTETEISAQPAVLSSLHTAITPSALFKFRNFGSVLRLDVRIDGVPDGYAATGDVASVTLQGTDGRMWKSALSQLGKTTSIWSLLPTPGNETRTAFSLDQNFVDAEHDKPLTLTASVYLTAYGDSHTKQIGLADCSTVTGNGASCPSVHVVDDLVCTGHRSEFGNTLRCRSASTLSNALVLVQNSSLESWISYAPYPGGFGFDPIQERQFFSKEPEFTVVTMKPIAHLRREFQATGIRLDDIKVESK